MNAQSRLVSRGLAIAIAAIGLIASQSATKTSAAENEMPSPGTSQDRDVSCAEVIVESLTGDVYADPSKWQELSYGDFFSKGWGESWVSPPNGSGGAPRQGWLNAYEGVFYRLGISVFGWQRELGGGGNGYSGSLTLFTPLNQRLEIQTDIPLVVNQRPPGMDRDSNYGDLQITPRIMLSESRDTTQTFNLTLRMPTGNDENGNRVASITPNYQFWTNPWKGSVVRGGVGFSIPYAGRIDRSGTRSSFNANLAAGYYFTPHDLTPIGDMVWYVATNLVQTLDDRGPSRTVVSIGPGFRNHLGRNWYLLGSVDVPVTHYEPYDYQVLGGLMKVF